MHCPVCRHADVTDFFSLSQVPVTCASVFDTAAEARALPTGRIDLACCAACGFVFNRSFDAKLGEISAKYESSQAASARFTQFARGLAADWIERYGLRGATVLEVGCGGGDFLSQLAAAGAGRVIGIDPLVEPTRKREGVEVIAAPFDTAQLHLPGSALACRHTLEHVPDVQSFLRLLRKWCEKDPDRVLLFELPDAERVFAERAFWDIYYEHCCYFTADTVRIAFELAGLEIVRLTRAYDDQYLIVEARLDPNPRDTLTAANDVLGRYRQFAQDVDASMRSCQTAMERLRAEQPPLILWQGAAKTVGFLASLPDRNVVDGAVDLSTQRQGKFLPGSGLPVLAPQELKRLQPKYVILMNPIYLQEVRTMVRDMGLQTTVHPVNALLESGADAIR